MSFNNPLCCGFVKAAIYEFQTESDKTYDEQIASLRELFPGLKFSKTVYKNRSKKVKETYSKLGKNSSDRRLKLLGHFQLTNGMNFQSTKKIDMAILNVKHLGAEKYRIFLSYLPLNSNDNASKNKAEESGLFNPIRQRVIEATKDDVVELNRKYKKDFSMTFESSYNIVKKKEDDTKRSDQRSEGEDREPVGRDISCQVIFDKSHKNSVYK